jgi:hypothetical protein
MAALFLIDLTKDTIVHWSRTNWPVTLMQEYVSHILLHLSSCGYRDFREPRKLIKVILHIHS